MDVKDAGVSGGGGGGAATRAAAAEAFLAVPVLVEGAGAAADWLSVMTPPSALCMCVGGVSGEGGAGGATIEKALTLSGRCAKVVEKAAGMVRGPFCRGEVQMAPPAPNVGAVDWARGL